MNFNPNVQTIDIPGKMKRPLDGVQLNKVMRGVYGWMTMGLAITAFVSFLLNATGFIPSQIMFFVVIIAQFGIVIGLSARMHKLSPTNAGLLFFTYSALTGVTFSIIFLVYPIGSILGAFVSTAGVFAAMTVVGMTTKTDLSQYSSYFMMGLIGLFIAMFVNFLLGSALIDYVISIFGVLLFTGLTAYDTQRIANMAADPRLALDPDNTLKFSVMAALTLYLDFINLFLFMLRLFGGGRD